jgi:hypothetical protein
VRRLLLEGLMPIVISRSLRFDRNVARPVLPRPKAKSSDAFDWLTKTPPVISNGNWKPAALI